MPPLPRSHTVVLVVEDDATLRTFFRSALMIAGYSVITSEDGIDALRSIEGNSPAIVVLDIGLPLLDGRDVIADMKSRGETRHTPVLVVSGLDPLDIDPQSVEGVLRKPVEAEELINAVDRCLTLTAESPPTV